MVSDVTDFARDARHFTFFVCAILGFVCEVLEKKRHSFEKWVQAVKKKS